MVDDLSQFFAKKTAKSKDKKKKHAVNVDEVGEVLERRAKRQEERERENDEEEKRIQEDAAFFDKHVEDSEWLEYKDTNKEIRLEGLAIRDMNLTDQAEEELEDEKIAPAETTKTWSSAKSGETTELAPETRPEPIRQQKTEVWRPPALRSSAISRAQNANMVVPDIKNETMFPSFAKADEMEKSKKDDEKKKPAQRNDGFTTVTSERENSRTGIQYSARENTSVWSRGAVTGSNSARSELLSAAKQTTMGEVRTPLPPPQPYPRNPNAYVPPSRRRAEVQREAM